VCRSSLEVLLQVLEGLLDELLLVLHLLLFIDSLSNSVQERLELLA
jgi:hypothetical protein